MAYRYILDTDSISLILYNHPQVIAKAAKHQFAITIITVQELFNGWVVRINDPSQVHKLPTILLAFAWTQSKDTPIILGHLNFFAEFNVCFFRHELAFEVCPRQK